MVTTLVLLTAAVVFGLLAFEPRLRRSSFWRATVTPLASIMGSGFLVVAPLLYATVGRYAVIAMAGLLAIAYLLGSVIRYNIRHAEPLLDGHKVAEPTEPRMHRMTLTFWHTSQKSRSPDLLGMTERTSHIVLAAAYFISVSYYLQLLATFTLQAIGHTQSQWLIRLIVTGIIAALGIIGTIAGLRAFERMEKYVVALNLGMIAALLVGLLWHNGQTVAAGQWHLPVRGLTGDGLHAARVLMGMLIVVQGFETSRFLGAEHSATERIKSMRRAQWISTGVYLAFIGLVTVMFDAPSASDATNVTAIILIAGLVAPVLPALVDVAALGSQFSAATADDAGCAGLLRSIVARFMPERFAYATVSLVAIAITWATDVLQIISLASRAFALYYAIQCAVAVMTAIRTRCHTDCQKPRVPVPVRIAGFAALGLVALAVAIFGIPAG